MPDDAQTGPPLIANRVIAVVAVLVLGLFGAGLAYLYAGGPAKEGPIPVVRAPAGDVKVAPDGAGGLEVRHRDKAVFSAIDGAEGPAAPALAAGAERPVDLGALADGGGEDLPLPAPKPSAALSDGATPERSEDSVVDPKGAPFGPEEWRVQLAAFSEWDGALDHWTMLQTEHGALLTGLRYHIQPSERRGRRFYRLLAGPLADQAAAARLCASLADRGQGCLQAPPGA